MSTWNTQLFVIARDPAVEVADSQGSTELWLYGVMMSSAVDVRSQYLPQSIRGEQIISVAPPTLIS